MKKLLSILSAFMLVSSASLPVVGCSIGNRVDESIDPVLEQQNFNVLAQSPEKIEQFLKEVKPNDFYFSNGFEGDNKFISDRSNGIEGSFGASKWTFIDMLNTKLNLGLAREAKAKKDWTPDEKTTIDDVEKNAIDWDVKNVEKLKDIKVAQVVGTYQEGGDKPVDNDSEKSVDAFNKIVKIGDIDDWDWKQQVEFLKSPYFADRTYTKKTKVAYGDTSFTFTQLIKLGSTGLFNKSNKDGTIPIDVMVKDLKEKYEQITGMAEGKELPDFTFDKYMNLLFSNMNIFTAQSQDYSVAVDLDCNNLLAQFKRAINNSVDLVNDYINDNNQKILANYFKNNLTKSDSDKTKTNNKFDSEDTSTLKIMKGVNTTEIPFNTETGYTKKPRIGMPIKIVKNDNQLVATPSKNFINSIVSYINSVLPNSVNITADQLSFSILNESDDPTKRTKDDLVLKEGDKIVITPKENAAPQDDSNVSISGEADLVDLDKDNMNSKQFNSKNKELDFIYVSKTSNLSKNDWLSKNFGIYSSDDLDKESIFYWIDLAQQKQAGLVGTLRSQIFKGDIKDVISRINKTMFSSSLNKDGLLTTNTKASLTDADYDNPINIDFDINGTLD